MSQYIFEATPDNFRELVIGNSVRGPVVVNYWSERAAPCMLLWPRLEALSKEFGGRFLLVNINTDKYTGFVQNELGVRSVPTLQIFHNQQVVDVVHGADSEASIRQLLLRHLPRDSDSLLVESVKLYNNQKVDEAIDSLRKLQKSDPENPRIATSIIKLLFREQRFDEMHKYIATQSSSVQGNEEVISLQTHALLQQEADKVEDAAALAQQHEQSPGDVERMFQLAALHAMRDELVDALELLLEVIAIKPDYRERIASRSMVLLLNALGSESAQAREYRSRMIDALSRAS